MKNSAVTYILLLLCISLAVSSCGSVSKKEVQEIKESAWSEGFDDGYHMGYYDAEAELDGYDDEHLTTVLIDETVMAACRYAASGDIDPMEARYIIECYQKQQPYYDNGSLPTWQDYNTAVNVLVDFYCYFENREYR